MSDKTQDSGEIAEKRVRKPRAPKASAAQTSIPLPEAPAPMAAPPPPAPAAPPPVAAPAPPVSPPPMAAPPSAQAAPPREARPQQPRHQHQPQQQPQQQQPQQQQPQQQQPSPQPSQDADSGQPGGQPSFDQQGGGVQGDGSQGQPGDNQRFNNNNRRDRFRNNRNSNSNNSNNNSRYRNRDDSGDQDGNQDGGSFQQQQFVSRQISSVPEGFPQYSLGDLKRMPMPKLLDIAEQLQIQEGVARARKQDVIFAVLKVLTRHGEGVAADGVLEILPDGYGFLRAAEASYLAGPDDVYISPSQIRRFNLRTGDHLSGRIRWPKDGERYFALAVVDTINGEPLEASKNKALFENLTPLFPRKRFKLERGDGSTEDITGRILDLVAP